jgi:DNA-binding FrmR family transcriptional regulator
MRLTEETTSELNRRLRRIEGQVRGIQQMIAEGRECREVIAQVSAASTALDQVGFKLLAAGLSHCLADPKEAAKNGFDLDEVEKLFLKLA